MKSPLAGLARGSCPQTTLQRARGGRRTDMIASGPTPCGHPGSNLPATSTRSIHRLLRQNGNRAPAGRERGALAEADITAGQAVHAAAGRCASAHAVAATASLAVEISATGFEQRRICQLMQGYGQLSPAARSSKASGGLPISERQYEMLLCDLTARSAALWAPIVAKTAKPTANHRRTLLGL